MDSILQQLDLFRGFLLKKNKVWLKPFIRHRELRVVVGGMFFISVLFVATLLFPLWLLAIGPILWGVPHVLADIRYLVIRPQLHKRRHLFVLGIIPLFLIAFGVIGVSGFLCCAGVFTLGLRGRWRTKLGVVFFLLSLAACSRYVGTRSFLIFAYLHNFLAIFLWFAWVKRRSSFYFLPLLLLCCCIASFFLIPTLSWSPFWETSPSGLGIHYHLSILAPGATKDVGARFVLLFAFTQAVHYLIWVRLIPEEDRKQPTPRTYQASWRALQKDFPVWILYLTILLALFFAAWSLFDLFQARLTYLRLILFHGYLELLAICVFFVEGFPSIEEGTSRGC